MRKVCMVSILEKVNDVLTRLYYEFICSATFQDNLTTEKLVIEISQNFILRYGLLQMTYNDEFKNGSTYYGFVMPFGNMDLDQHWLRQWLVAWRHQAIIWTNVDYPSQKFCDIYLRASLQWVPKLLFCMVCLKSILLKLLPHPPGSMNKSETDTNFQLRDRAEAFVRISPVFLGKQYGSSSMKVQTYVKNTQVYLMESPLW